jgi:hypothetical protein
VRWWIINNAREINFHIYCKYFNFRKALNRLFLPPAPPSPQAANAGAGEGDLSGRAGLFFNEHTGEPLRLVASNNALSIAGGGPLVALANERFRNQRSSLSFMSQDEFDLRFLSAD